MFLLNRPRSVHLLVDAHAPNLSNPRQIPNATQSKLLRGCILRVVCKLFAIPRFLRDQRWAPTTQRYPISPLTLLCALCASALSSLSYFLAAFFLSPGFALNAPKNSFVGNVLITSFFSSHPRRAITTP